MQLRYIGRAVAFFDPSSRRVVPLPATCVGVVVLCSCGYDFDAPFALSAWADASGEAGGGLSDAPLGDGAGAAGGSEMGGSAGAAAGGTGGAATGGTGGAATGGTGGAATGGTGGTATGGFGAGGQDACVPATCASLGAGCGQVDDGCGATLDCGMCPADQPCVDDGTMTYCCTPLTCSGLQAQCGDWPDGCGSLVSCGNCTPPGKCIQDTSGATCRIACSPGDPLVDSCVAAQDWACRGDCDSLIGDTTVTSLAECADFCIAQNATCCAYGDPTCSECSGGGNCGAFHTFDTSPHETADSYILCLD